MALQQAIEKVVTERLTFGRKCEHLILSNTMHNLLVTEIDGIENIIAQMKKEGKSRKLKSYRDMKVIILDRDDMYFTVG
ncbi:hypothetical protein M3_0204 [Lysinibacillus phage vB_LfM_LysYB1]|nr:hypothetical protein M3_0204 [Lysinibacillus phage vB_LfM_LysYB1]WAB25284.1 hypothetical protein M5_0106 [Lysinibacillus phage vB_LfM_LysYB2]